MSWLKLSIVAICFSFWAQPVAAGQVRQLVKSLGCIKSVWPGKKTNKGIHTGELSNSFIVRRCSGQYLRISHKGQTLVPTILVDGVVAKNSGHARQNSLVDMQLARGAGLVREAWLIGPTRRYGHGILGDDIEAGGFAVKTADNLVLEYHLDKQSVFEDLIARLVDLDGDGENEIVIVQAYLDRGAALAVFSVIDNKIIRLGETSAIGRSNRWLNPAAVADFDGDGQVEIAWVETPHIGGILKIARFVGKGNKRQLKLLGNLSGFSNHTIGSRELLESVTFDWDGDGNSDIILPGAGRATIKVVSMAGGKLRVIDEMAIDGKINSALVASDLNNDGKGEVLIATKDGRLFAFSQRK